MGSNVTTTEDLKKMGLVKNPDGSYSAPRVLMGPKTEARVNRLKKEMEIKYGGKSGEVSIDGPPIYYMIEGKKYYLTANVMYSSNYWTVRHKITVWAKRFLKDYMRHLKALEPHSTLLVVFSTKRNISPKTNYDVDNRGYFWCKMFQDVLEELKLVPNDNAYWISEVRYKFDHERKEENLTFKII